MVTMCSNLIDADPGTNPLDYPRRVPRAMEGSKNLKQPEESFEKYSLEIMDHGSL